MCEHGRAGGGRQLHWHTMGFAGTRWQFSRTIKRLQTFINSFAAAAALPEKPRVLRDALTSCPSLPELWKRRSGVWTQSCRPLIPLPRGEDRGELEREKEMRRYAEQKERVFYFQLLLGLSPPPCAPLPFIALLCPLLFLSLGMDGPFVHCVGTGFKCESTVSFWYCTTKSVTDRYKSSIGEDLLKVLQSNSVS